MYCGIENREENFDSVLNHDDEILLIDHGLKKRYSNF